MPRGRKPKLTLEEQAQKIQEEIEGLEIEIDVKKSQLLDINNKIEQEKVEQLMDAISKSGKTIDDVYDFLNS